MKMLFSIISLVLISSLLSLAQTSIPSPDIKPNEVYADQNQIANDVAAKATLTPFPLPDAKSMVNINESGDGIISLPFVNVKGRKLSLPINISYVTSGIKVEQNASEVGLGWNVSMPSITRDYGAYEPDYTYTGSEFLMRDGLGSSHDKQLRSTHFFSYPGGSGFDNYIRPINQNKIMDYNNVSGKAPDNYIVNIPGQPSNDFWNSEPTIPASGTAPLPPTFVFSEKNGWKVDYVKVNFLVSQEISRINELTYHSDPGNLTGTSNLASAIALYPYVIHNQYSQCVINPGNNLSDCYGLADYIQPSGSLTPSPNNSVIYEDYGGFTITTADGTKYIFDRPLRGQKYLFTDEPFWSTMNAIPYLTLSGGGSAPFDRSYGEFWKTDYVAEWLLSEIHSSDYVDANSNGIADDGDYGDWIKIDYTDPIQIENLSGIPASNAEPTHREFLNFTQTDRASSIWRERAYITKITTPVEVVNFNSSQRFDVNHDYFKAPFNRVNNEYVYNCKIVDGFGGYTTGLIPGYNPATGTFVLPTVVDYFTCVNYPIELLRYDGANVQDNISGSLPIVQNIKLNYAAQGSSQQLAVSNYLILQNDGVTFYPYDPSTLGGTLDPTYFHVTSGNGRGKTTLLGIDYRGNSLTSTDKISYSFNYANNPTYDHIHMCQIWQQGSGPAIRESQTSVSNPQRWPQLRTVTVPGGGGANYPLPNSIQPWKSIEMNGSFLGPGPFAINNTENWGFPIYEDELGYYNDGSLPINGRDAWSLSSINLPYGGSINLTYEKDAVDITNARNAWIQNGIGDYCIPSVGHFNNISHMRSIIQDFVTKSCETDYLGAPYSAPAINYAAKLFSEYYFLLNQSSGGLRLGQVSISDGYVAPPLIKSYSYGTGHFNMPTADYWGKYLQGFSSFLYNEKIKHSYENYQIVVSQLDGMDFTAAMLRLNEHVRIDNTISTQAKHYYENITETNQDGSQTKRYFGQLYNNFTNLNPGIVYQDTKNCAIKIGNNDRYNVVEALVSDMDNSKKIGNYLTELYNNTGQLIKSTKTNYIFNEYNSNTISCSTANLTQYIYDTYLPDTYNLDLIPWISSTMPLYYTGNTYLVPVNSFEFFPTPLPSSLYFSSSLIGMTTYGLTISMLDEINYSNNVISSRSEAINPIMKIGSLAGNYATSSLPSWFASINLSTPPWSSGPYLSSDYHLALNDYYTNLNNAPQRWRPLQEPSYSINSISSYKSHQSYSLLPSHTQTITNFY